MRILTIAVLALTFGAGSVQAQLRARPASASAAAIDPSTRLIVGNATISGDCTTAEALEFSNALRNKLSKLLNEKPTVLTRDLMNAALKAYGYTPDEVLPAEEVHRLAETIRAGHVVTARLVKDGGKLAVVASVRGKGEVTLAQADGQSIADLGESVAEQIRSNFR